MKPFSSGDHKIIAHGTVISYGNKSVEFDMSESVAAGNKVIFSFPTDESKTAKIEFEISPNKTSLELKLFNFDSAIDIGNADPIVMGQKDGKDLLLNYRIRKAGDSRTIDYSLYIHE